ncbi:MAG TPA: DUF397 domain-containing protein [Pseudonocardiaceae bacterium]
MGDPTWRKSSYSSSQENCVELRKSSYSSGGENCVEVGPGAVRDSKNPDGPVLSGDVAALVAAVKRRQLLGGGLGR